MAILRRKIVDHQRKLSRSVHVDAEALAVSGEFFTARGKWTTSSTKWRTTPNEVAENSEFWRVFQNCMSELPLHLAQAFQLRELARLSVDDASRMTGITSRNLAVRLHRARLLLRQCLSAKWFDNDR